MNEFITVTIVGALILLMSIFVTRSVLQDLIVDQNKQTSSVVYQQARSTIDLFIDDVELLRLSLINDYNIRAFFEKSDFPDRWQKLEEVQQLAGNSRRLNKSLENISFYDETARLFFSHGASQSNTLHAITDNRIEYSVVRNKYHTSVNYLEAILTVYGNLSLSNGNQIGRISLLYNMKNLQETLDSSLLNNASGIALVDSNNEIIIQAGTLSNEYFSSMKSGENDDSIYYSERVKGTNWRLINVIPKESLIEGVALTQRVIYITYFVAIIVFAFMIALVYLKVLRPITKQISFMIDYQESRRLRTGVFMNNEIGDLATEMNLMLDNIELLNSENIDMKQRNFELQISKKQAELIAYRSQINPHFLYNTFECIQGMALHHGIKDIASIVQAMSRLYRQSVSGGEMITIQDELILLEQYKKIIYYRFAGRYKINIRSNDEAKNCLIPKMIIQPLVENAVIHGLEASAYASDLDVDIRYRKEIDQIEIVVMDNGIGMDDAVYKAIIMDIKNYDQTGVISNFDNGIGLINVYNRLRLHYGSSVDFTINTSPEAGTEITIIIKELKKFDA